MPDAIRERFDALRHAVQDTDAGGLPDVRARRTRRTRTRVAAATAAAVAALAIGGVVVLPDLDGGDATSSAGGGAEVLSDSAAEAGTDRADSDDQIGAEQAPPEDAPPGPLTLTEDSLLTAPELMALGEQDPQLQAESPGPAFPPLCAASTGTEQYSDPIRGFSVLHSVIDGTVSQFAAEYDSDAAATEAIDKLLLDARSCPDFNPRGRLTVDSRTPGETLMLGFIEPGAGPNGAPRFTEITVLRRANILVEVALIPSAMGLGGGKARARTVADAVVANL